MKKLILTLCALISLFVFTSQVNAQIYKFRAVEFAYKEVSERTGTWTDWTDWKKCNNVVVTMNCYKNVVTFNTEREQIYYITEYVSNYVDNSGGKQAKMKFYDQDFDKGFMRLRTETNGNQQIYIEYANMMWVYNVKLITY